MQTSDFDYHLPLTNISSPNRQPSRGTPRACWCSTVIRVRYSTANSAAFPTTCARVTFW